jgi:hypothetical protein
MIALCAEVIKMCANVSYIMMTLNRYLLIGRDHASCLTVIGKLNFKWLMIISVIISSLLNIGHMWEYTAIDDKMFIESDLSYIVYDMMQDSYSDYPFANQGQSYFIYSCVYFAINFGVLFLLNTGVEVMIVWRMHKELKDKRERRLNVFHLLPIEDANQPNAETGIRRQEEEDGRKERQIIKMVLLNGVLNFILRAPDALFWLENSANWSLILTNSFESFNNLTQTFVPGLFNLLADFGYFTYILTFSTNFFVFYKFNSKFNECVLVSGRKSGVSNQNPIS